MKQDHIFSSNGRVEIKEINQWGPKFWSNGSARGHLTILLLWATVRLLVTCFKSHLPSGWVPFKGNEKVGSVQGSILLILCLM